MKRKNLVVCLVGVLLTFFSPRSGIARYHGNEDTDARIVDARVVEVAESHISVLARSGVEHVVAVDVTSTKVSIDGRSISLKDIRNGDIVTIELDSKKAVKFARNIAMRSNQVARLRR